MQCDRGKVVRNAMIALLTVAWLCVVFQLHHILILDPANESWAAANTRKHHVNDELPHIMKNYDVVVVGAGLSGAVLAERHAHVLGHRVLVLEKRDHIAGNTYDYIDGDTGIRVSRYGAHLFHTQNRRVWQYVRDFAKWERWDHKVLANVGEKYVNMPVNINTVNALFDTNIQNSTEMDAWLASVQEKYDRPKNSEEMAKSRIGVQLYEMLIKPYTIKQWNCSPTDLDPSVTARIPVRNNFDDRYFADRYQYLPKHGYTDLVARMLDDEKITVMLDTEFTPRLVDGFDGIMYYTGPVDQYFDYTYERLQYRSLLFEKKVVRNHEGTVYPVSVVNYPDSKYPYTRVVEYKHFLTQKSPHTVLFYEYSIDAGEGEPYYPVPSERNHMLYERYRLMALGESCSNNVWFIGRLANYKYFNMDQAIDNALHYFDSFADVHVVLSVYKEDVGWFKNICEAIGPDRRTAFFVYVKDSGRNSIETELNFANCKTVLVNVTHLPNVGRESHSWFYYIANVARPGHRVIFLQGGNDYFRKEDWVQTIHDALSTNHGSDDPFISISAMKEDTILSHLTGKPGPAQGTGVYKGSKDVPLMLYDEKIMGRLVKQIIGHGIDIEHELQHNYRGEFMVYGTNILQVAKVFHKEIPEWIHGLSMENSPLVGFCFERLWFEIFKQARIRFGKIFNE